MNHKRLKAIYREKRYVCGAYLDVYTYPVVPYAKPTHGKRTKKRPSREVQKKLNQRHARERMARVMHANFDENDLALTLTYRENPESREQAVKKFQRWLRKIRRLYKQSGLELKYIWQMERSRKGRYHVHAVISGGVDRDTLEKLWVHGYANTKRLQFDDSGLAALARYITKSHHEDGEERVTYRSYNGSKNLINPEPEISDTRIRSRKRAAALADMDPDAWAELYPDYQVVDIETFHSDEYGGIYLFARLCHTEARKARANRRRARK